MKTFKNNCLKRISSENSLKMDSPGYICFLFWNTWLYNLLRFLVWGDMNALCHLIIFAYITECINNNIFQEHKGSENQITVIGKEHDGRIQKLVESSSEDITDSAVRKHNNSDNEITVIGKEHEERIQKLVESPSEDFTDNAVQKHKNRDNGRITVSGKEQEVRNNGIITVIGKEDGGRVEKLVESSSVRSKKSKNELAESESGMKIGSEMNPKLNMKMDSSSNILGTGSVELLKELHIDLQEPYSKTSICVWRKKPQC